MPISDEELAVQARHRFVQSILNIRFRLISVSCAVSDLASQEFSHAAGVTATLSEIQAEIDQLSLKISSLENSHV